MLDLDKLGHGYAGVGVYSITRLTALSLGLSHEEAMLLGVISSFVVGGLKEVYDSGHGGTVDSMDAIATGLGGFVGLTNSWEF